jgi:CPA2 family monovalent cation:H+ antiporter-2
MHSLDLILILTLGLGAALILGYVTQRLGLSPIVGYLLAGILVGPNTPGFVADPHLAEQLAEIGVILLMFGVGLHFHLDELLAVRKIAVPGAVFQSVVATILGMLLAAAAGWGWALGAVFGLALSVASTVVITRVLSDNDDLHTRTGHIAVGWLVVEDLFTVLVLVILPPLFGGGGNGGAGGVLLAAGWAMVKIGVLVAVTLPLGGRVIPWLLNRVSATGSRELFTLTVLVVAMGIAVASWTVFGVSMALGAFLAGMVVGRSEFSLRAASDALPMRDAFAVLFFVSVGMRLDPKFLTDSPWIVLGTLAVVVLGKPLAAGLIVILFRHRVRTALAVAVALGQIGEFSFILADLKIDRPAAEVEKEKQDRLAAGEKETDIKVEAKAKILPPPAMNALVVAAIISISLNPLLYRGVEPAERWLRRRPRLWRWLTSREQQPGGANPAADAGIEPRYRAVVVGYGPVGQTMVRLLRENEIESTVIEMNVETVRRLRDEGIAAVYGDAAHADTLKEAGVATAGTLALTSSGMKAADEVVRTARRLNPDIRVIARSAYLRERAELRQAGADAVFAGEGEVALAMTESVLRELGASAEQIDRERARVRADLFGDPTPRANTPA